MGRGIMYGSFESLSIRSETETDKKSKRQKRKHLLEEQLSERPKKDDLKVKVNINENKKGKEKGGLTTITARA